MACQVRQSGCENAHLRRVKHVAQPRAPTSRLRPLPLVLPDCRQGQIRKQSLAITVIMVPALRGPGNVLVFTRLFSVDRYETATKQVCRMGCKHLGLETWQFVARSSMTTRMWGSSSPIGPRSKTISK